MGTLNTRERTHISNALCKRIKLRIMNWKKKFGEKKRTHLEGRKLKPEDEEGLESEIPRQVIQDETESKGLQEVEETKDNPIGQPLNIILNTWAFEGFE